MNTACRYPGCEAVLASDSRRVLCPAHDRLFRAVNSRRKFHGRAPFTVPQWRARVMQMARDKIEDRKPLASVAIVQRNCLKCGRPFPAAGKFNRVCRACACANRKGRVTQRKDFKR